MKKISIFLAAFAMAISSCDKNNNNNTGGNTNPDNEDYKGFLYTSNNSSAGNGIIAMGRKSDGKLTELPASPYNTGSAGDAADNDFDHQYGLRIFGDYLLAVNAGANPVNGTISVYKIDRETGNLTQVDQNPSTPAMDNMDSRGERPVTLAAKTIGGTTYVAVGNQHSNPNYQKPSAMLVGSFVTTPNRNVAVFTMDMATGRLSFKNIGATYMEPTYGGPSCVDFNSDGSKLAVSTWGVAHILTPEPDLSLQRPGRLYIYNFSDGALVETGRYEDTGVSGNIGITWSPNEQYIYMANFNLHSSKEDYSVTVHNSSTAALVQHFATGERNDEACWTWISNDKTKLFISSFTGSIVSTFDIKPNQQLGVSLTPNFWRRKGVPEEDTKDEYQSSDGYLYVSGAFKSHSVSIYTVAPNGALSEIQGSPYRVPSSKGKTKLEHAYIGLMGFDK